MKPLTHEQRLRLEEARLRQRETKRRIKLLALRPDAIEQWIRDELDRLFAAN